MATSTPTLMIGEIAKIYPDISGEEEKSMEADIVANGVLQPIVVIGREIIDGKNRYRIAKRRGIPFDVVPFRGTPLEAIAYVRSLNAERRHMTSSQRAMAAVKSQALRDKYAGKGGFADDEFKKPSGDIASKVAEESGTNRQYIFDAMRIEEEDPELGDRVLSGELSIPQAKAELPRHEHGPPRTWAKFDDRKIDNAYDALSNLLHERKSIMGRCDEYKAAVARLNESMAAFRQWQKKS